jgi:type IV pilus assembly protein PilM
MAIHRVVSIEIGLAKTRIVETDFKKKNPKIYKCAIFDTPENTIEDAYVRDKKVFGDALKRELEKADIRCKNFMFTMNSSKILSREVNLPKVKENLLPGIIEGQKDEYFPMDISEHKLAYTIIAEDTAEGQYRAIVYAVPDTLIKNYFNLAEELDGKLVALDYAGNSVYRWVQKNAEKDPQPFDMVLQMNVQNTLVMILENGVMTLQRNINYGTNNVVEAYKDALRDDTVKNVEIYKRLAGEKIVKDRFNEADSEHTEGVSEQEWLKNAEIKDSVTDAVRPFIMNINRVIEYYSTRNKQARIPAIKFTGLGTSINGLSNLIQNEIGLPVKVENSLTDAAFVHECDANVEHTADLIACVGGAIETIRFLDVQFDADKKSGGNESIALMIVLLLVLILAGAAVMVLKYMEKSDLEKKRNELAAEYDRKIYIEAIESKYQTAKNTIAEIEGIQKSTYTHNEELNELIADLEKALPGTTIVHSLSSTGQMLILSITVPDKATAAQLIMQLQDLDQIAIVSVTSLTEVSDEVTEITEVSFTATCIYTEKTTEVTE